MGMIGRNASLASNSNGRPRENKRGGMEREDEDRKRGC